MKIKFHLVELFLTSIICILLIIVSCKKDKDEAMPKLETVSITAINCHSALSGGKIESESGMNILQKGVCYCKSTTPDTSHNRTINGEGTSSYTSIISGLEIETKYFVRAYIITSFGIEYGKELSFTTSSCDSFIYGGKTYHAIQIGNQCWMTENLSIGVTLHGNQNQLNNGTLEQYAYNNKDSNLVHYGGLYQWNELIGFSLGSNTNPSGIRGISPPNWHIPSDAEWQELELFIGMNNADVQLSGWRGSVGTSLKPGGIAGLNIQFGGRIISGTF
ncbi:FISUMP domain-containing protein, partial [Bacteroidota bacterium]